jgi:shikimate kinase
MADPLFRNSGYRSSGPVPKAVFLVGFMGAGKTTIGRCVARRLGWRFVDLDNRVEAREGRTVADIFRDSGESAFRAAEAAALHELLGEIGAGTNTVIALGGGTYVQPANAEAILLSGAPVIFVDAAFEELVRRCSAKGTVRPLFQNAEQFRRLYEDRRRSYVKADLRLDTTFKRAEAAADELISFLGLGK